MKLNTKLAIRLAILTVGVVGTFIAGSSRIISVADGGPILLCAPSDKKCQAQNPLPRLVADGGPILLCAPSDKKCQAQNPLPRLVADGGPILVCPPSDKSCKENLPHLSIA